jgi:hypothetical protein
MLRVKIEDATVAVRNLPERVATADRPGRGAMTMKSQNGILTAGRFTYPLNILLGTDQAPYAPGDYLIDDESFHVDEYESFGLRRGGLKLKSALVDAARRPAGAG